METAYPGLLESSHSLCGSFLSLALAGQCVQVTIRRGRRYFLKPHALSFSKMHQGEVTFPHDHRPLTLLCLTLAPPPILFAPDQTPLTHVSTFHYFANFGLNGYMSLWSAVYCFSASGLFPCHPAYTGASRTILSSSFFFFLGEETLG